MKYFTPLHLCFTILLALGGFSVIAGQPEIDRLQDKLREPSQTIKEQIVLHLELAKVYGLSEPKSAYNEIELALAACKKSGDRELEMEALNQLGILLYNNSLYDSSIAVYSNLIVKAESYKSTKMLAMAQLNLAVNYMDMGKNTIALDYYIKTLKLLRKLGQKHDEAHALANIGIIYTNKKEFKKAYEYFAKALDIIKWLKPGQDELCIAYLELADLCCQMKDFKLAKLYADSAENFTKGCKDLYTFFVISSVQGDLYKNEKQFSKAEEQYIKAIEFAKQIDFVAGLADAQIKLGKCYWEQGKTDKALEQIYSANALSYKLKTYKLIAETEQFLGKLMIQKGFYSEANAHIENYGLYMDSMMSTEMSNMSQEMQARFEIQEAAYQNDIIRQGKDEEIKVQKIYTLLITIVAVIFIIFSIFEYFRYRRKQQLNNRLLVLNQEIINQKNELEEKSIILSKLSKEVEQKNRLLERENNEKNNRLVEYAFYNAHELRSSVANILGLVYVIKNGYHTEDDLMYILEMLQTASGNLDQIIKDFGKKLVTENIHELQRISA